MKALAFSRDRPMQLDALLRSLSMHSTEELGVDVLCKFTSKRTLDAYTVALNQPHCARVNFHAEQDFEADVRRLLARAGEHALFLVDDTVFVRRWEPSLCATAMTRGPGAIGVSLRLGDNATYCYPHARAQPIPDRGPLPDDIGTGLWAHHWPGADGDFGYPLELSSSVYRTADILAALEGVSFTNPNTLEATLAARAPMFASARPWLMSYETSVAFSVPANRVQNTYANRAGSNPELSAEALLQAWEDGYRIDVEALAGYTPRGAHEEVPLKFMRRSP
jgi:hypothetical protein